ncbi:T9SS type A sorting domain-containing protein [Hymenobacter caeli]|uniref:Secretion system C-terminal sorting domain-containing protein n=1 Tax=Hymenobacter caeli TaxID=2735894 RepID=A0ABX2FUK5_9BACT|nr:T9SS type A sorting domain-containing protein [Hymenobacter caeli]NRT20117.1 hypothetical protein [Hymenobacter caeli]
MKGTGTPGTPTITINPAALGFNNQIINTQSNPMTVTVNGTSLTAPIVVTAPTGFQVSTDNSTYTSSVSLAPNGGAVTNATVYIVFKPTAAQGYVSNVTLTSPGAADQSLSVSGTGVMPTPVLNVSPTTLPDYGSVVVGNSGTATNSFTVGGQNLQSSVTITPPMGFRIRTGTDVFSTNPIVLTVTNGTIPTTTVDVRFTPTAAQAYKDSVIVSTPNGSTAKVARYVKVSGTATPAPTGPTVIVNPGAIDFGTVTSSGSTNTRTFDVSGTNLTANIVLTPSANTLQFRNASAGGAFSSNPLTLTQTNGTVATQTIEVKLVATVPGAAYSETIAAASNTASATVVVTANNSSGKISDISATNPNGNDFTFATRPTTTSVSQSFRVSGTNLLQNLTVAPTGPNAGYFQVSSDNVTFTSSLTYVPDMNGNVPQQTVYVRFVPGDNAVTVNANISSSSSPARTADVSVTGISQPTLRLSRTIPAFPADIVKGTTSAATTVRLDGFLLGSNVDIRFPADGSDLARNPQRTPAFQFSLDGGMTYDTTGTVMPDPMTGNFSQNLMVRFAPVRVGNAAQELQFRNPSFSNGNYFVLSSGFGQASGFAISTQPTVQSTASVTRSTDGTSVNIAFNLSNPPAGTAYGQNRLVIATPTYAQFPTNLFPQDKQNFDPGTTDSNGAYVFGKGSAIEASSNTYAVFSGASSTFNVSGLDPNTQYYFYAFEFNNDGVLNAENYLVPNNQPLSPLPVQLVSFTARRSGKQVNLNWVTASEKNSRSFDVERSADGRQFTAILSKAAQGTSSARTSYDAVDRQPLPGLSYYRLKQIDLDGTVAYSPVVSVQGDGAVAIGIYPNPTAGKLTISLPQALADAAPRVSISDMMGRVVKEMALPANGEVDLSALPAGTYLVNVGGQQVHGRVVKF